MPAFEAVVADLPGIVRSLGEPLFDEHFDDPTNRHVIYTDGTCLEVMVWPEDELSITGPFRVLFDRTGVPERLEAAASNPGPRDEPGPHPATDEVRRRIVWFWHDVEHLVTALGRGQTWWAYGQLDELRRACLDLARMADGAEIEPGEALLEGGRVGRGGASGRARADGGATGIPSGSRGRPRPHRGLPRAGPRSSDRATASSTRTHWTDWSPASCRLCATALAALPVAPGHRVYG